MKKTGFLVFIGLIAVSSAPASIIYEFDSVTPSGGAFDWKYTAKLSADQKIDNTTLTDFAVVYDFMGVTSATTSNVAAGLTLTNSLELTTVPQPFGQSIVDSPTVKNVRTQIAGSFKPTLITSIYDIDIVSTIGAGSTFVFQSAQAVKNAPGTGADGTQTGNTAQINGPGTVTPEPSTAVLLSGALLGFGLLRKKLVRR